MRRAALAACVLAGTAGGAALGQSFEGSTLSATLAERFEINDNYDLDDPSPGTSYFADTRLGLGFLNETDTQIFALGLDTGLRALWQADEDFKFTVASPTSANLDYSNEWADGLFDAALDYRQRQVNYSFFDFVDDTGGGLPDDLEQIQGDSRELRYDANVGVVFGTSTRSSYALRFAGTQIDYSEETPSQVARTTLNGQAAWTLQLNPVLASQVSADYLYYDAQNAANTQLRRSQVGAGVLYTPTEILTLGLGVNYADRQREDTNTAGARQTTEDNRGPGINGSFSYTLPDLLLVGNGEFSTAAPTGRFIGALRAVYTLPRGRLTGRVFQNYTGTSGGGTEARVTGVSLGVVRELNAVSSVGVDFRYATQVDVDDGPGPGDPDIDRANLTATYSHALTEVVAADIGYSYSSRSEDPSDASSNAVFFQIARTFETRP